MDFLLEDSLSTEQLRQCIKVFQQEEAKESIQPISCHMMRQFLQLPYDEEMLQRGCLMMEFLSDVFDYAMKNKLKLDCFNLFWPEQILEKFSLLLKEANQHSDFESIFTNCIFSLNYFKLLPISFKFNPEDKLKEYNDYLIHNLQERIYLKEYEHIVAAVTATVIESLCHFPTYFSILDFVTCTVFQSNDLTHSKEFFDRFMNVFNRESASLESCLIFINALFDQSISTESILQIIYTNDFLFLLEILQRELQGMSQVPDPTNRRISCIEALITIVSHPCYVSEFELVQYDEFVEIIQKILDQKEYSSKQLKEICVKFLKLSL